LQKGAMTIVWACVVGIFLPDNPVKAKFVTEREKAIVIERLRVDQTGVENKHFKKEQMVEAFLDPKTWLMFLFQIWISIPNGGLTNFTPLIINGLGYSAQRSVLLTMPTGIMQTMSSYICNGGVFLCIKYFPTKHFRTAWILFGIIIGLVAAVFLYTLPLENYHGRLAALYISYFYLGPYIVSLGLNAANTAGHTKKVTVNALTFIAVSTQNKTYFKFFSERHGWFQYSPEHVASMSITKLTCLIYSIVFPTSWHLSFSKPTKLRYMRLEWAQY
jgi:ACS family allantoate permease-like MFS transporter